MCRPRAPSTPRTCLLSRQRRNGRSASEAHACDSVRGCRRRQSVSRDRNSASDLDCGKASDLERAEGISVLQKARTGIIGNGAAPRYRSRAALAHDEIRKTWNGVGVQPLLFAEASRVIDREDEI